MIAKDGLRAWSAGSELTPRRQVHSSLSTLKDVVILKRSILSLVCIL